MKFQTEIDNLIRSKSGFEKSNEEIKDNIVFTLMTDGNQPYSEIRIMPIPIVMMFCRRINEINSQRKAEEDEIKCQNRKF
jgi:hypothetical protein